LKIHAPSSRKNPDENCSVPASYTNALSKIGASVAPSLSSCNLRNCDCGALCGFSNMLASLEKVGKTQGNGSI
jgi:hypothetical protein